MVFIVSQSPPESVRHSRRWLLTARGLGSASGGLLGVALQDNLQPLLGPEDTSRDFGRWCLGRRAMACEFTISLPPTLPDAMTPGHFALDLIDDMEELLTVYRDSSAMSYVNAHAARRIVRTDARLFRLLKRSAELTELTQGAFDVSTGALIKTWGFFRGPRRVPGDDELSTALAACGMRNVVLDEEELSVRYLCPGLEINLGSIGKGYALDVAFERLQEELGVHCALMQGGNSSIKAMGSITGKDHGWLVGVQNPFEPGKRIATVRLRDQAMGTAGSANQYFEANGRRYGHVIDPRTGSPAGTFETDVAGSAFSGRIVGSVSVVAADAATADALATGLYVMGLDKAIDFCQNHPEVGALIATREVDRGKVSPMPRVLTFNLPPEDVNLKPGM